MILKIDPQEILRSRLVLPKQGPMHADTDLRNFALINYALPKKRLESHIPDCFDIPEFEIDGVKMSLLSVVPFYDDNFRLSSFPLIKSHFFQTNFRVYVINKKTSEHVAWFFGTTLGSQFVRIPQLLWKLPWHHAKYNSQCEYDNFAKRFKKYEIHIFSNWCNADIDIEDTGRAMGNVKGFASLDEMRLILTHPIEGYFYRRDGKIGTYSIWHEEMKGTIGKGRKIYFSLFEKLNLLSREEMNQPHSIFLCPQIKFKICLPPIVFHD